MMKTTPEAFSRLELLVGSDGLARLQQARVLLCGAGGVGSWAAEALIRGAVGHLTIVDYDRVKASNLNRQLQALHSTLGNGKAECLRERLLDIAPQAEIRALNQRLTPENCLELLLSQTWSYVIDAIDERVAKLALLKTCVEERIPVISSMGSGNKLNAGRIQVGDLFQTSGCPLAKLLRKNLKKTGISGAVQVVFSGELPVLLSNGRFTGQAEEEAGKRPLGSISYMPALFGLHCAAYVLEKLLVSEAYQRKGD
jgi:tRNA A37 threonylcarbamoyladenosine dehydratase